MHAREHTHTPYLSLTYSQPPHYDPYLSWLANPSSGVSGCTVTHSLGLSTYRMIDLHCTYEVFQKCSRFIKPADGESKPASQLRSLLVSS